MIRILLISTLAAVLATASSTTEIFVAPVSEKIAAIADGTKIHPFTKIHDARDALRRAPGRGGTVYLRGGDHFLRAPLELDARDSGTAASPVTYAPWPGDATPVRVHGGQAIPASAFTPAKGMAGVYVASLFAHGVNASVLGSMANPYPKAKLELFVGGKPMTLARDPNIADDPLRTWLWAGYENMTAVASDGLSFTFADADRGARWRDALTAPNGGGDLWLHGYWKFDWRDTFVKVASITPAAAPSGAFTVTRDPKTPPQYPWVAHTRFYAVNALALLDAPGEYWVDASKGLLYFMPPGGVADLDDVVVSTLDTVIAVTNADHIKFVNLTISTARGQTMSLSNARMVRS